MSSKLPYFRWHPKDFDTDQNVRLMSMCEVGLYVMCLNHCWVNGSLPNDLRKIAKIVGQPLAQVKKSWPAVSKCFIENSDSQLINEKQEKERKWAQERRDKSKDAVDLRDNKKATAAPKKEDFSGGEELEKDDHPYAYDSECVSVSSETQTTNQEKTSTRARGEKLDFETFMHRWNRHRGFKKPNKPIRERAEPKWNAVEMDEQELSAALDGYFDSDWGKSQSYPMLGFLKNPHSWISDPVEAAEESIFAVPEDRDFPAEWNELVPSAKVTWSSDHSPVAALRVCADDPVFRERFREVCQTVQMIYDVRGADANWINFSWILRRKNGEGYGWWRIITEFRGMSVRSKSKAELAMERA